VQIGNLLMLHGGLPTCRYKLVDGSPSSPADDPGMTFRLNRDMR
jgi:hypothetical protein